MKLLAALAVVVALALQVAIAAAADNDPPMRPEAKRLLDLGAQHFSQGHYDAAIQALRQGYQIDPRREFLYALGQAERKAGHCAEAITAYQAYLQTDPPLREATHALVNIERCKAKPDTQPSVVTAIEQPPPAPRQAEARRPIYRDVAGAVLAAVGVAGLAAGLTTMILADQEVGRANSAAVYRDRQEALGRRDTYRVIGIVGLAVGGAAAAGAALRYVWVARRRSSRAAATLAPTVGGAMLSLDGTW